MVCIQHPTLPSNSTSLQQDLLDITCTGTWKSKTYPTHDAGKVGIFTIAFKVQKVKRSCSASPSTDDWITYKAPMMMSHNGKRFCHHPDLQNVFLWIRPIRKVHEQSMKSPEVD